MAGWGGALRPGLHPGPGRLREPPWGYYGPCARSLARRGGAAIARRQACDDPLREAGTPCPSAIDAPPNGSAARGFQIAGKRSATGRAKGGSILPRRILAQRKRLSIHRASRRSAAPHLKRTRQRGRAKTYA